MSYIVEVCIDNIESLHLAIEGGAGRIELCSSLALGGLTPSFGLMKQAGKLSSVPVYAMIRPRQGDFLYTEQEIESMLIDIEAAADAGLQGVVLGTLNEDGHIDMNAAQRLVNQAKSLKLGVTFHRAIDQCADYQRSIADIAELGCERVLTSGLASNIDQGLDVLRHMVELADDRFSIMAGAGLNAENVYKIVSESAVQEVHLSGKSTRPSKMKLIAEQAKMGSQNIDDFVVPVTDPQAIEKVVKVLTSS
ncbi:copper homeostasis protein CutC [Vibrio neptunius]|uniref:copper homeostasis protein CutC n=1 Tax=Vibrio neptunius TaxID=170651 RepID=UPI0005F9CECA|nr:copper homeostasis protein CutC [Vibrio neptunius]KJY88126.1 copper homeostasis protein CutC [Vibrio neptunius]